MIAAVGAAAGEGTVPPLPMLASSAPAADFAAMMATEGARLLPAKLSPPAPVASTMIVVPPVPDTDPGDTPAGPAARRADDRDADDPAILAAVAPPLVPVPQPSLSEAIAGHGDHLGEAATGEPYPTPRPLVAPDGAGLFARGTIVTAPATPTEAPDRRIAADGPPVAGPPCETGQAAPDAAPLLIARAALAPATGMPANVMLAPSMADEATVAPPLAARSTAAVTLPTSPAETPAPPLTEAERRTVTRPRPAPPPADPRMPMVAPASAPVAVRPPAGPAAQPGLAHLPVPDQDDRVPQPIVVATLPPLSNLRDEPRSPAVPPPIAEAPHVAVDTPALGSVGAEVSRAPDRGDALRVHFAVDRPATAALIAGDSGGLDRALAAAGVRLDTVTVQVRGEATSMSGFGDAPRREPPPPLAVPPRQLQRSRLAARVAPPLTDRYA